MRHLLISLDGVNYMCTGCLWVLISVDEDHARANHAVVHETMYTFA